MRIILGAGKYVVAVSGGVDSMVLLDLLNKRPGLKLIIAHYDHGIRKDSDLDRKLVQKIANKHKLPFVHKQGRLGPNTSEAKARKARYDFLEKVKIASDAGAIITAHHEDDVLETAIINLIRGTGRSGLTSLKSSERIIRPLISYSKDQIKEYAIQHSLAWREDETNQNTIYLRNYIRAHVIPYLSPGKRAELLILLESLRNINVEIDGYLNTMLHVQPALNVIDKKWFVNLPYAVSKEILRTWLQKHGAKDVSKNTIERISVAMKTGKIGRKIDIDSKVFIIIGKDQLALQHRER